MLGLFCFVLCYSLDSFDFHFAFSFRLWLKYSTSAHLCQGKRREKWDARCVTRMSCAALDAPFSLLEDTALYADHDAKEIGRATRAIFLRLVRCWVGGATLSLLFSVPCAAVRRGRPSCMHGANRAAWAGPGHSITPGPRYTRVVKSLTVA